MQSGDIVLIMIWCISMVFMRGEGRNNTAVFRDSGSSGLIHVPIAYGSEVVIAGKASECKAMKFQTTFRVCGADPASVNECQAVYGYIQHAKRSSESAISCSFEEKCPNNMYSDSSCGCSNTADKCYHEASNCYVPKVKTLAAGDCTKKDWDANAPKFCSIGEPKPECEQMGQIVSVSYVITGDGVTHYLDELSIELSQSVDREESYIHDNRLKNTIVAGTAAYCSHFPEFHNCYTTISDTKLNYRILKKNLMIPHVHLGGCSAPVHCYGTKPILTFQYKQRIVDKTCPGCIITCDEENYHIITPIPGNKHAVVCGRTKCDIVDYKEHTYLAPRSFQSKVTDERLTFKVYNEDRMLVVSNATSCPLVDICKAIDCFWCKTRWMNPTCYKYYDWILMILALYSTMVMVGVTIAVSKPIIQLLWFLIMVLYRLAKKLSYILCGRVKRTARTVHNYSVDADLESQPMVYKPTTVSKQPKRGTRLHFPTFSVILMVSLCGLRVDSKAPCSSVITDTLTSESCVISGDVYKCKTKKVSEVPLISYDQTSCLSHISPSGKEMASLQITPLDISFKCSKHFLYYTRDFEMKSDHRTRCPGAGQCSDEWCHGVNKDTAIDDLPPIQYPYDQFCKLGEACWGHGCFYCTNSCHSIRYYARPRSERVYEVFNCPRWDPSGAFHLTWESPNGNIETTVTLIHGQSYALNQDITVSLDLSIQSKLPILGKSFITDGETTAIIGASFEGQPVAGEIGQIQCKSRERATSFKDCSMAPNICICRPEGSDDGCDCSQVYMDKAFSSDNKLPISILDYHIEVIRDLPYLKTSAFGTGRIKVSSNLNLVGSAIPPEDCRVSLITITGCYSCIKGSEISYTCESNSPMSTIAQCNSNITLVLHCDASGQKKTARFQSPSPLITLDCSTPCSKSHFGASGVLVHVSTEVASDVGHINLLPTEVQDTGLSWFKKIWSLLGWLNMIWIGFCLLVIFAVFMLVRSYFKHDERIIKVFKTS